MRLYNTTTKFQFKATIVLFGDEFLGRSPHNFQSFNVILRNDKIPYRKREFDFQCEPQSPESSAFIVFGCDSIGRFKTTVATQLEVMDVLLAELSEETSSTSRLLTDLRPWIDINDVINNLKNVLSISSISNKL